MATSISSAGIGSGLDVNSIVSQLMSLETRPLLKLQTASTKMETQLSTFGQLRSAVSELRDTTTPLLLADSYSLTSSASSDPASVSAGSTSKAVPGSYAVTVTSLAAAQSIVSPTGQFTDSTSVVGTGTLTIQLGTWDATGVTFTPKAGASSVVVPIGASEQTLAGVRDKINAANSGVTASVVSDASGARLALRSTSTGAANGFSVSVADSDGNSTDATGLSRLSFSSAAKVMLSAQPAANLEGTINGIAVSSPNGSLTEAVEGMTFNLNKLTTAPVTITVARNTEPIKASLNKFITAYNQLNKFLADSTKYDVAKKEAALLQGDSTAVGIQNQLRQTLAKSGGASSVFATLSDLGVQLQKDGSLTLNESKFSSAIANLPELTKALSNVDVANPANDGFAKRFALWADKLLGIGGALPGKTQAIQQRIDSNRKDQERMSDRLTRIEERLRARYTALDTTMAGANALSKYVTQQITTWNKSTAT